MERRLPLLPNNIDNGRQIVQMNIVSQDDIRTTPRVIAPKILNIDKSEHNIVPTNSIGVQLDTINGVSNMNKVPNSFGSSVVTANIDNNCIMTSSSTIDITDNAITPSRVGSPTSISNLLELALNPQNDNLLDNRNLEHKDDTGIPSFVGKLHGLFKLKMFFNHVFDFRFII